MSTPESPSFKIIGGDGKEYGPIDLATLQQWTREGRIAGPTQIWDSRAANWLPAAQIAELTDLFGAAPPAPAATPQPQPAPAATTAPGVELASQILQSGYTVAFGEWISQGWIFFKNNLGFVLGTCWIVFGLSFVAGLLGAIPCLGHVVQLAFNIVVQPVLMGGLWYVLLRRYRGQPAAAGEVFDGFKLFFAQSLLVNLIMTLIILAAVLPGALVVGVGAISIHSNHVLGGSLIAAGAVLAIIPVFYLGVCYGFAMPLVADRRMQFWPAMETSRRVVMKHWFGIFAFGFVTGLLGLLGVFACGVGLIFTVPMCFCMFMAAYENIFGRAA